MTRPGGVSPFSHSIQEASSFDGSGGGRSSVTSRSYRAVEPTRSVAVLLDVLGDPLTRLDELLVVEHRGHLGELLRARVLAQLLQLAHVVGHGLADDLDVLLDL